MVGLVALGEEEAVPRAETEGIETGKEVGKDIVPDLLVAGATNSLDSHTCTHKPLHGGDLRVACL